MHFGPYPEKRDLPPFVKKLETEDLALKMLRQRNALDAEHKKELADAQKKADRLAEKLALLVHKKRFTENDPFVMSLRQLLKNEGILLITHVGEEVTESLEDEADIVEWLPPSEDPADRVVDALEPEVHWEGRLLHRAKLSCRQGAEEETAETVPAEAAAAAETIEEEVPAEAEAAADVSQEAEGFSEDGTSAEAEATAEASSGAEPAEAETAAEVFSEVTAAEAEEDFSEVAAAEVEAEDFSEVRSAEPENAYPEGEEAEDGFIAEAESEDSSFTEERPLEKTFGKDGAEDGFFARIISAIRGWFTGDL